MSDVSEKSLKTEIEKVQTLKEANVIVLQPKKSNYNSKRRKSKKSKAIKSDKKSSISKIDEVVNILCNTISKNKSEESSTNYFQDDLIKGTTPMTINPNVTKVKKKQSTLPAQKDTKYVRYLTPNELKIMSNFGVLLSGIIRINQKNFKEAYITAPDKGLDIFIEGLRDRNRALEGDEVFFMLKPKEHHRKDSVDTQRTAVVVGIKTFSHFRGAIGTLIPISKKKNANFALFSPRDLKLPRIRISRSNWPEGFSENSEKFNNILYFAKITQWDDIRFADG